MRSIKIFIFVLLVLFNHCQYIPVAGSTTNADNVDQLYVFMNYFENEQICSESGSIRGINNLCFRAGGSNMIFDLNSSSYISGTVSANTPLRCRCPENAADSNTGWYLYIPANANTTVGLDLVSSSYTSDLQQTLANYSSGEQFACMPLYCPSTRFYQLIDAVP